MAAASDDGRTTASGAVTSEEPPTAPIVVDAPTTQSHEHDGLYLAETFSLMLDRWQKLYKDFYSAKLGRYDLTKVPDVYDMIRFDALHNSHLQLEGMEELLKLSTAFENSVVPQEYGTDKDDKRKIGSQMVKALLEKIKGDISVTMVRN